MLTLKRHKLTLVLFLLLGIGYFSAMSSLEINYFLKSLIAILPLQLGALIYVSQPRWSRR
ncbi:hypothetical protein H6G41_05835 [Tolypothrix sp. FACHB-123]|uniref:hypothetical protein n=1 Tax=Tolypothrix sp. FACHB-123 TaxID=2692868 RepID=UPI001683C937|nr:hypothetical protein [Tolypothrix sp. FACHB-123]MBD2354147.1 hypothetical protein [Tolypothrix sp. FACHB-123]